MSNILKSYFGSYFREASNDGDELKKVEKGSLDLLLNQDDTDIFIFEDIYSPRWTSILFGCIELDELTEYNWSQPQQLMPRL